jgi:hypothetical protein
MFKVVPADIVISPTDEMSYYVSQHVAAFVLLGVAVLAAIVLLVIVFRRSRKKGP